MVIGIHGSILDFLKIFSKEMTLDLLSRNSIFKLVAIKRYVLKKRDAHFVYCCEQISKLTFTLK